MQFLKRGLMAAGALALAVTLLNLAAPKRVHAAVASLVQVANTIANPAITQDTSKAAAQLVDLQCAPAYNGGEIACQAANGGSAGYTVPSGQNLAITSITILPMPATLGAGGVQMLTVSSTCSSFNAPTFTVTNTTSSHFEYPSSAQVVAAGCQVVATMDGATTSNLNPTLVWVNGYLTAN
jgi:hypothetical protein